MGLGKNSKHDMTKYFEIKGGFLKDNRKSVRSPGYFKRLIPLIAGHYHMVWPCLKYLYQNTNLLQQTGFSLREQK